MLDINKLRSLRPNKLNTYIDNTNGLRRPDYDIGEYLPPLRDSEIEIVRNSLASNTGDVYSIRAKINHENIYGINVSDEYEYQFDNYKTEYLKIPSQGEIFDILIVMKCG